MHLNGWDILILIIILALLALAVFLYQSGNKKSACCGDCGKCGKSCAEPEKKR